MSGEDRKMNDDAETVQVVLTRITMDNFEQVLALSVDESQKSFVASNSYSLSEAYADQVSQPYAVYANEQMVGFVMYDYDTAKHIAYISRLMIDKRFQKKGFGEKAMRLLLQEIRRIAGCQNIMISYHPENVNAAKLYRRLGFTETGEVADDGEIVCKISL